MRIIKNILFISITFLITYSLSAKTLYLDNFNSTNDYNLQGGNYQISGQISSMIRDSINPFGNNGSTLVLEYDVTSGIGTFSMEFKTNGNPIDMTQYDYITFRIKGENSGEAFHLQLEDSVSLSRYVCIKNFLPGGLITAEWQKVVVPVKAFDPDEPFDSTQVKKLHFIFKTGLGINNSKVYIDEMVLSTGASPVYLDNMEYDETSDGGSEDLDAVSFQILSGTYCAGVSLKTNTLNTDHKSYLGQGSYKLYHNIGSVQDCGVASTTWFMFPNPPPETEGLDIEACNALTFYLKSEYTNIFTELRFYAALGYINTNLYISGTNWTPITINWAGDTNADCLTNTRFFSFQTSGWLGVPAFYANSFWVDEIRFIDTIPPQRPFNIQANNNNLHSGYNFTTGNITITASVTSNESHDSSLEALMLEYRKDNGAWKIMGFDYETEKTIFTIIWDTTGMFERDNIDVRVSTLDCSGQMTSVTFYGCSIGPLNDEVFHLMDPNTQLTPEVPLDVYLKCGSTIIQAWFNVIGCSNINHIPINKIEDNLYKGTYTIIENDYIKDGIVRVFWQKQYTIESNDIPIKIDIGNKIEAHRGKDIYILSKDEVLTKVLIPNRALPEDCTGTINQITHYPDKIAYDFSLHSYQTHKPITSFHKPLTIFIHYNINNNTVEKFNLSKEDFTKVATLYYFDGVQWLDIGGSINLTKNNIYGNVQHLSTFAIGINNNSGEFSVSPNPFTPNNDSINDRLFFRYVFELEEPKRAEIKIFSLEGVLIKQLSEQDGIINNQSIEMGWDGINNFGHESLPGLYIYQVKIGNKKYNGSFILAK